MKESSSDLLTRHLDELAAFEADGLPFISLYLNAQADEHGRDNFESFIRKEFSSRGRTYREGSPERKSFDRDAARIAEYLQNDLQASANGLALFACAGAGDFFKAIQLAAPFNSNKLYVAASPHLYPLARLINQNPRYVALIADTNSARLFVFDLGRLMRSNELNNAGRNLAQDGEWSQLRYRRRVEKYNYLHAKEVIRMLEQTVRDEGVDHIILAGDEVIIPLLCERMPLHLADKIVDVLRLDIRAPEHEILKATTDALREDNLQTDAEKVRDLLDGFRAGGLAIVGLRETLKALSQGQVDELLLTASIDEITPEDRAETSMVSTFAAGGGTALRSREPDPGEIADALVARARLTGASVTFIEDPKLLAGFGGVGAFLRYRA